MPSGLAIDEARTNEGATALLCARAITELRTDIADATAYRRRVYDACPSLDRASLRTLLAIGDAFGEDPDLARLARFGLRRLAIAARAPEALRTSLLAGPQLPLSEMRRAIAEAKAAASVAAIRNGTNGDGKDRDQRDAPVAPVPGRADALVDLVTRHWHDLTRASIETARAIVEATASVSNGTRERLLIQFGLDEQEIAESAALLETAAAMPIERRDRIGLGALFAIAKLPPDQRDAVLRRVIADEIVGDDVIDLVRGTETATDRAVGFNLLHAAPRSTSAVGEPTPAAIISYVLERTTIPGDAVLDLTAGLGTVADVATSMGRVAKSVDIIDPPLRPFIAVADARTYDPGRRFRLVFLHPPVPLETRYSELFAGRAIGSDLSLLDPVAYRAALGDLVVAAAKHVDDHGWLAIVCREQYWRGRFYDWPSMIAQLVVEATGLAIVDRIYTLLAPEDRFRLRHRTERVPVLFTTWLVRR